MIYIFDFFAKVLGKLAKFCQIIDSFFQLYFSKNATQGHFTLFKILMIPPLRAKHLSEKSLFHLRNSNFPDDWLLLKCKV